MGVLFGLLTAIGFGCADFVAKPTAEREGAFRTALYVQPIGAALVIALLALRRPDQPLNGAGIGFAVGAGMALAVAYAALYQGLAVGLAGVVTSLVASYGVLAAAIAALTLGERLSPGKIGASALTLAGVAVTALHWEEQRARRGGLPLLVGAPEALVAAGALAIGFVLLDRAVARVGVLAALLVGRAVVGMALVPVTALGGRPAWPPPKGWGLALVAAIAACDTLGYVAFAVGTERAPVAIVAVTSSTHSLVTAALAYWLLGERLRRPQLVGVAAIVAGVAALAW